MENQNFGVFVQALTSVHPEMRFLVKIKACEINQQKQLTPVFLIS